ncbi:MAG TPA: hypothetical protein VLD36_14145 [Burkholderiales bacterium]|nr:hypothetical protein [Burkholderiales bacterium]
MDLVVPFLKALALVPLPLLPIINPLSTAPVFIATVGRNKRIVALILLCIGIQIMWNGWAELNHLAH